MADFRWIIIAGVTAIALPAQAQDTTLRGNEAFDELVVTAQRRQQNLLDIGVSVAAYSGEQLLRQNITSSVDVARIMPGVFVSSSNGGQFAQFSIRGVTQNDIADGVEGPVAVYVDDGYIPNLQGQSFGLFDLERVEILKGPQGTLFGRNATGGLVHFIVEKPTAAPEGHLNLSYGAHDEKKIEAALSGPIFGKLLGRASFYWHRQGPWMDNVYPAGIDPTILSALGPPASPCCTDLGTEDTLGGRLQFQVSPSDNLTIRAAGMVTRQNLSTSPYNSVPTSVVVDGSGNVVGGEYVSPTDTRTAIGPGGVNYTGFGGAPPSRLPGADWFGYTPPGADALETASDFAQTDSNRTRSYNGALHIDYDRDGINIASVTDYKKFTKEFGLDADAAPYNLVDVWASAETSSISQELRASGEAGKLTWMAGFYYLRIHTDSSMAFVALPGSIYAGVFGMAATGVDLANVNAITTSSYSLFSQIEYKFLPKWTIVAGSRIIGETQKFDFTSMAYLNRKNYGIDFDTPLFELQPAFNDERDDLLWAGKLQIEYRPIEGLLVYAGVNRGVKGGNYNSKVADGSPPLAPDAIPYKPEILLSYEAGVKASLLRNRLTVESSVFYYDYSDYQAFTFSNISGIVQNQDAQSIGAEFDITIRPAKGLELGAGLSLIDATVKDVVIAPGALRLRDVQPTFTPKTQISGRIGYSFGEPLLSGSISLGMDAHHASSFYQNIRNFNAHLLDGYSIFNAHANWVSESGQYSFGVFIENFTDERYAITAFDLSTVCGCSEIAYGKPRWWGISAGFKL